MLSLVMVNVAFYCYAECHYSECRYDECCGAVLIHHDVNNCCKLLLYQKSQTYLLDNSPQLRSE
jgi:hypothetical protein